MGLLSIFFKPKEFNPLTFEKDLNEISSKILITERRVVEFKQNSLRFNQWAIRLLIGVYVGYIGFLVKSWTPTIELYYLVVAILAPLFIYGVRSLLVLYHKRILKYYLGKIRFYKKQKQEKIKDLKTKTNFQKTQKLLQKYSVLDFQKEIQDEQPAATAEASDDDDDNTLDLIEEKYEEKQELQRKRAQIRAGVYVPKEDRKSLLSKFFDLLAGADEQAPSNRYALICIKCFTHNGLAPPRFLPNQIKFVCFKCGEVNNPDAGSRQRSTNLASPEISAPATPTVTSPTVTSHEVPDDKIKTT